MNRTARTRRKPSVNVEYKDGKLAVTKIEAAVRQLETAITLWSSDGDAVSVCTLAFAAYEILHVLSDGVRKHSTLMDMGAIKEEFREVVRAEIRADPNFCKHAARDPNETRYLAVTLHPMVILDALRMYNSLGMAPRPIFRTFQQWMWITMPDIYETKPKDVFGTNVDIEKVIADGKKTFFSILVPEFERRIAKATVGKAISQLGRASAL